VARPGKGNKPPADPEATAILARQGLRYRVLRLVYDLGEGAVERPVRAHALREREGLSTLALDQVLAYLRDEKLINAPPYDISMVSLRHKGLVEIERAILDPSKGTEHFDARVTSAFVRDRTGAVRGMRIAGTDPAVPKPGK
jgi:hypothetical protein